MKAKSQLKKFLSSLRSDEGVSLSVKEFYSGHLNVTYKGVKAIRCPTDYLLYQMIIGEVRPDLIIEIGCNQGGGVMYLADLMTLYNISGEVHGIDIHGGAIENVSSYKNIKIFSNGWENYDLSMATRFKKILVIEDAAHTYECTRDAIKKFAPIVSKDSYLIVEDGIVDELGRSKEFNGGPLKAIREFLLVHSEFVVDRRWCDFFGKNATFNVNGYLRKIR